MADEKKYEELLKGKGKAIIDMFHEIYYYLAEKTWMNTYWMGAQTLKNPLDMWIYQEIIFEIKPDLIIETGTYSGGSALFMAMVCDQMKNGLIMTVDVEVKSSRPEHPRIKYLTGSSTSEEVAGEMRKAAGCAKKVLVILDSEHARDHVFNELRIYSHLVTAGSYLIVEDTNINGHPVRPGWGPGPMEAVDDFLKENKEFVIDSTREKFLFTQNPKGFLKKLK